MNILSDVFAELFSMFVSDRWLTLAILVLIAISAVLAQMVQGILVGAFLLLGCLTILVWAVHAEAARRSNS